MKIYLNGKYYTYLPDSKTENYGYCSGPDAKKRFIAIGKKGNQTPKTRLDTEIHEMLHAAHWPAAEWWVSRTAKEIADALWKLGYRKINEGRKTPKKKGKRRRIPKSL